MVSQNIVKFKEDEGSNEIGTLISDPSLSKKKESKHMSSLKKYLKEDKENEKPSLMNSVKSKANKMLRKANKATISPGFTPNFTSGTKFKA